MSDKTNSSGQCIPPSELTPEQLETLPIDLDTLTSFDEREKLPPTARAQWNYVKVNPEEYIDRFTTELSLLGIRVAMCFINNEVYHDTKKELKTPITVHLMVKAEYFEEVKEHLENKRLSHLVMDENKGFALPYLGSTQKTLDTLALESITNLVYIKNFISRESYQIWISIPESYLHKEPSDSTKVGDNTVFAEESPSNSLISNREGQHQRPSDSRTPTEQAKEDFNYVVYDDEEDSDLRIKIRQPEEQKPTSVIVANRSEEPKKSFLKKRRRKKKSNKQQTAKATAASDQSPTAKLDSFLFLGLSLFNFYCTILLFTFLGQTTSLLTSMMVEAVTFAALAALLLAILVVRPSIRKSGCRLWTLGAYAIYSGIAGYQILLSTNFPESGSYLAPTAVTSVSLLTAIFSGFMRVDRISRRKSKQENKKDKQEEQKEQTESTPAEEPVAQPPVMAKNLPPPVRKPAKDEPKKIELKTPISDKGESATSALPGSARARSNKPLSEEQKAAIRSRLARTKKTPSDSNSSVNQSKRGQSLASTSGSETESLSTEDLKAKVASKLQQARSIAEEVKPSTSADEQKPVKLQRKANEASVKETSATSEAIENDPGCENKEDAKSVKLSLPKSE